MQLMPRDLLVDVDSPIRYYQSIPKNGCSTIKGSIFKSRFGFDFPEISHPKRHGALFHIHHLYKTRPVKEKEISGLAPRSLLLVLREPNERFISAFVEKILFNEAFDNENEIIQRAADLLNQVFTGAYEGRIVKDHFSPQSVWVKKVPRDAIFPIFLNDIEKFLRLSKSNNVTSDQCYTAGDLKFIKSNLVDLLRSEQRLVSKTFKDDNLLCDMAIRFSNEEI